MDDLPEFRFNFRPANLFSSADNFPAALGIRIPLGLLLDYPDWIHPVFLPVGQTRHRVRAQQYQRRLKCPSRKDYSDERVAE